MKILEINDEDYAKALKLLADNGIDVSSKPLGPALFIRPGQRQPGDNPANFGGIWANDERTMASIREKAWPKRR